MAILGTGWLGLATARRLSETGYSVKGSSRQVSTREELLKIGAAAYAVDLPDIGPEVLPFFAHNQVLIVTLPPGGRRHGPEAREKYLKKLSALLPFLKADTAPRVIYTSSTGVYGDSPGLLDESAPLAPASHSSEAVVAAEEFLREHASQLTILRLAGLVGTGRHPGRFYGGRDRKIPQGDAPVNLVQREDVVAAIELVIGNNLWGETFNICAGAHPPKAQFYQLAAGALDLPVAGAMPGGKEGKVISSEKIRARGWSPQYDTAEKLIPTD